MSSYHLKASLRNNGSKEIIAEFTRNLEIKESEFKVSDLSLGDGYRNELSRLTSPLLNSIANTLYQNLQNQQLMDFSLELNVKANCLPGTSGEGLQPRSESVDKIKINGVEVLGT